MPKTATARTVLLRTRALVFNRQAWIKGSFAALRVKSRQVYILSRLDKRANCWCLQGALDEACARLNASETVTERVEERIRSVLRRRHLSTSIPRFNDSSRTKHATILSVLNEALEG